MSKKNDAVSIEIGDLCIESVIENFCDSSIVFITDKGKLMGAITEGDIKRFFRDGWNVDIIKEDLIQYNIKYIVAGKEHVDIFAQAAKIFSDYPKIHNIPVVNNERILLYQIDRHENIKLEYVKQSCLLNCVGADVPSSSFAVFLECLSAEGHIVLAGADVQILNWVKEYLVKELSNCGRIYKISVLKNILNLRKIDKNAVVLCISEAVACLVQVVFCPVPVVSLEEIRQYGYYMKLAKIKLDTIANFFELFGYDMLCFCGRNKYVKNLIHKIENCGGHVIERNKTQIIYLRETQLCAFSMNGEGVEKISLRGFYEILEKIQKYRCVVSESDGKK